ncbi:MAG: hypothetical protein KKB21_04580 [Nanoarchaeota archaeon]|nr:hypothetical protein [Nanoarchaeota archaeon]
MKTFEIVHIILAAIVSAFVVRFNALSIETFMMAFIFFILIFIFSIGAKKLAANFLQSDIETKILHFQRWGWYERSYFKTPIPIGLLFPFFLIILTLGRVPWLATTQTEIIASKAKIAKKHGIYRYSEMTDSDLAWITSAGIFACFILAILAYLLNLPDLSRYAILFACFNMIPLGQIDGTKIFFGNLLLWFILAIISLLGLGYIFLLV